MQIRKCMSQDIPCLAVMNKRLIEDEKSSNPMNLDELERRMEDFLATDYHAYFFMEDEKILGYALVRLSSDPIYLRQFYIDREYRRNHYGRKAFEILMDMLGTDEITIDVLPWNETGCMFWESLGFSETCISMKYKRQRIESES